MTGATAGILRHDALLYGSDEAFVDALAPFVRAGVDAGEAVVIVTGRANAALLRDALAAEAGGVSLIDAAEWYRHPPEAIAGYRRVLDERLAAGAGLVRVVGEVCFGQTDERQSEWVRYEAVLNHVFRSAPAWIICPYDLRVLPERVLRHALHTHPCVYRAGRRETSAAYRTPEQVLNRLGAGVPEPPEPLVAELVVEGALHPVRQALGELASREGLDAQEGSDLAVAVNEALTNALRHGVAPVRLQVYAGGSRVICDVSDAGGDFADPLAGYTPPPVARGPERGMGLWVARQLCDVVEVLPARGRTVLRLTKRRSS